MRSVLWKVFALWNYLGSYNNLSFLFFFFFLKKTKGREKGEHWSTLSTLHQSVVAAVAVYEDVKV